jgi:hypothetical protein
MENTKDLTAPLDKADDKENKQIDKKSSYPTREEFNKRINYEILPIGELRSQAKTLLIKDYKELNKQKLIDAIREAKNNIFRSSLE